MDVTVPPPRRTDVPGPGCELGGGDRMVTSQGDARLAASGVAGTDRAQGRVLPLK